MYYFLDRVIVDGKKDYSLTGILYDNDKKKVDDIFDDGKRHENLSTPFLFILDESNSLLKKRTLTDKISSDAIGSDILFLLSPKAVELVEKHAGEDVESYEVRVKSSSLELEDYRIVKIIDKIDCVDLEESDLDYDEDDDSIDSAESIVLDESKIPPGKQIFLLGKRYAGVIIVHEDLKNAIEESGLTGFSFYELTDASGIIA